MGKTEFTEEKILQGVREIFAAKGFDASSMQNLAKGVGMSVGNFYRYFPSKSAIVEAMARRDLKTIEAEFEKIAQAVHSRAAFKEMLRNSLLNTTKTDAAIWMEIEAAASRTPEIAAKLMVVEDAIETQLVRAFSFAFSVPMAEAQTAFGDQAQLIMTLLHGIRKSRAKGPISPSLIEVCIGLIDHIFGSTGKNLRDATPSKGA